jgi:hypothetical protein
VHAADELPGVSEDDMSIKNDQRKHSKPVRAIALPSVRGFVEGSSRSHLLERHFRIVSGLPTIRPEPQGEAHRAAFRNRHDDSATRAAGARRSR